MKVLIISHNPMSTQFGIGKTLLSLFSEFEKNEICQLYTNQALPDQDVCESYFRITDKEVLKGVFSRKLRSGTVSAQNVVSDVTRKTASNPKNRQPHREIARDIIWKVSPWYSKELKKWLSEQKPTCIFAAIGSGKFLYDMAIKIADDLDIPLFTYVCDDFYFMKAPKAPLGKMWKRLIVKETNKLIAKTDALVTICDELSNQYEKFFNKKAYTIMTGTNYSVSETPKNTDTVLTLSYFGRLNINRYRSLAGIARAIDEINKEKNTGFSIDIYSEDPSDEVLEEFKGIQSAKFCGFLNGNAFSERFFASQTLVHVEDFDEASVERVRYSVSTKIADSLASGIILFAYGPEEVASIQHLIRNRCAVVATSNSELKSKLETLFFGAEMRNAVCNNAIKTAELYHDPKNVSRRLYECLKTGKNI